MVNLRGEVVTVLDVATLVRVNNENPDGGIVRYFIITDSGVTLAWGVEAVEGVTRLKDEELMPPPEGIGVEGVIAITEREGLVPIVELQKMSRPVTMGGGISP